jgi:hypothetical protein
MRKEYVTSGFKGISAILDKHEFTTRIIPFFYYLPYWNMETDIPHQTRQNWEDVLCQPVERSILLQQLHPCGPVAPITSGKYKFYGDTVRNFLFHKIRHIILRYKNEQVETKQREKQDKRNSDFNFYPNIKDGGILLIAKWYTFTNTSSHGRCNRRCEVRVWKNKGRYCP